MSIRKNKEKPQDEDEEFNKCLELVKDRINEQLDTIMVGALQRASKKPSIWWEWLFLILTGMFGGVGLGLLIAYWVVKPNVVVIPHG
jgi:hypothetical protein